MQPRVTLAGQGGVGLAPEPAPLGVEGAEGEGHIYFC